MNREEAPETRISVSDLIEQIAQQTVQLPNREAWPEIAIALMRAKLRPATAGSLRAVVWDRRSELRRAAKRAATAARAT
jgi:uncharacterized radical SAM superfamily Fe-S cluster-containing enzyme